MKDCMQYRRTWRVARSTERLAKHSSRFVIFEKSNRGMSLGAGPGCEDVMLHSFPQCRYLSGKLLTNKLAADAYREQQHVEILIKAFAVEGNVIPVAWLR